MTNDTLTNVHDALVRAQDATKKKLRLENANFKVNPEKKKLAEQICEKNATTFSEWLRECVDGLVGDYIGRDTLEKMDYEQTQAQVEG